jgi:hypothetical protein
MAWCLVKHRYNFTFIFTILYHVTALKKRISTVSVLLDCSFVNFQRSDPYKNAGKAITPYNFSQVRFRHVPNNVISALETVHNGHTELPYTPACT